MPDTTTIFSVILGYALFRLAWWWGKKYLVYMKQQREVSTPVETNVQEQEPLVKYRPQNIGMYSGNLLHLGGGDPELMTRLEKELKEAAEVQDEPQSDE